jgi:uncharacterized protein YutE (UPF0331/DUF86 family)
MNDLRDRIDAELENIQRSINMLPTSDQLSVINTLELAGVAGILHSFYNGVENILKQIFKANDWPLPMGASWHRDLLKEVEARKILPTDIVLTLRDYLAFRHFFIHAYALDVNPQRMEFLVEQMPLLFSKLRTLFSEYEQTEGT